VSKREVGEHSEVRAWQPRVIWGRIAGALSSGSSAHAGNGFAEPNKTEVRDRKPVGLHIAGGVAAISLRRPDKMNAINCGMWETVSRLVHHVSKDERARVLVLRGEGENFSAGSDLKELGESDLARVEEIFHRAEECAAALEESPLPTIGCIRGYALGTGLLMALACDLRVAEQNAVVGIPIARLGITLSEAFVRRIAALTGPAKMKDLVYTGRLVDGEEAVRLGLVDRVVPQNKSVLHETLRISRVIRQQSSASVLAAKRWGGSGSGRVPAAYSHVDPDDFSEGVRAFLEQRPPDSTKPRTSLRSRSHLRRCIDSRARGVSCTELRDLP
jgi:enoyl-CoA hydratase